MSDDRKALISIAVTHLAGAAFAWAGSQGGAMAGPVSVFAGAVAVAFALQWFAFIPSFLHRTERWFDATGAITYVAIVALAFALSPPPDARIALLATAVVAWATRLGSYLFRRIRRQGGDERFAEITPHVWRFLNVWAVQALWVTITAGAALAAITSESRGPVDVFLVIGMCIWVAGFSIESVADLQKSRFLAQPENRGEFIRDGLWAWSRHPNYFGEITLWTGIAIAAAPALQGWQLVTLVSPVFVALLITKVSGLPLLERKADQTWGDRPEYQAYKAATPVLVPRPPRRSR